MKKNANYFEWFGLCLYKCIQVTNPFSISTIFIFSYSTQWWKRAVFFTSTELKRCSYNIWLNFSFTSRASWWQYMCVLWQVYHHFHHSQFHLWNYGWAFNCPFRWITLTCSIKWPLIFQPLHYSCPVVQLSTSLPPFSVIHISLHSFRRNILDGNWWVSFKHFAVIFA